MKKRYIKILTVVLSSTVLLGGCGGTKIYSASAADSSLISEDSASDTVVITDKSGESSSDTSETTSQKSGDSDSGEAEKNRSLRRV